MKRGSPNSTPWDLYQKILDLIWSNIQLQWRIRCESPVLRDAIVGEHFGSAAHNVSAPAFSFTSSSDYKRNEDQILIEIFPAWERWKPWLQCSKPLLLWISSQYNVAIISFILNWLNFCLKHSKLWDREVWIVSVLTCSWRVHSPWPDMFMIYCFWNNIALIVL